MRWLKRFVRGNTSEKEDSLSQELSQWKLVSVKNAETATALVIRIRLTQPSRINASRFKTAVEVVWPYEGTMPASVVNEQHKAFDTATVPLSGYNDFSELMQVTTGNGEKRWLFYTSDVKRFMHDLNALLEDHEPFPITVDSFEDPQWKIWSEVADAIIETT